MKRYGLFSIFFLAVVTCLRGESQQITAVQEALKARGLYYGKVTGKNDNETAAAITRFQVRSGIEVTGKLNDETLRFLGLEPSEVVEPNAGGEALRTIEAWRALRDQDRKFLEQTTSPPSEAGVPAEVPEVSSMDQIRDFVAGFVVAGISPDVEPELQFYAEKADYYDRGIVSKDFIRNDILRYNDKWPTRRYWLDGDIQILNSVEADPLEVRYQIKYAVKSPQKEARGTAIKTLKLRKTENGLEIISVREKTLN